MLEESLCATRLKLVIIIEDCNVIFIATSTLKVTLFSVWRLCTLAKKWDVHDCKIKVSKTFTQSEKLRWTIFKCNLLGLGMLFFVITHLKVLFITFFFIRNRALAKKIRKLWSCTQNGRKVWRTWSFINLSKSTSSHYWLIALQHTHLHVEHC